MFLALKFDSHLNCFPRQYYDNVLKGLATSISVVLSSVLSAVLFSTSLSIKFCIGSLLVLGSVYGFGAFVPSARMEVAVQGSGPEAAERNAEDSLASPLLVV